MNVNDHCPGPYDDNTNRRMVTFASRLSEPDRRAFAAIEAYRIGRGGVKAMANLLGMSPETIKKGREDLDDPERLPEDGRKRHRGAGRKGVLAEQPGLEEAFDRIVESHIAGDPMNEDVIWTDLQPAGMIEQLEAEGYTISENTVRSLLKKKIFGNASPSKR